MLATLRRYGRNAQWRLRRGAEAAGFAGMGTAAFVQGNRDRRAGLRRVGGYQLKSRLRKPRKTIKSRATHGRTGVSTRRVSAKRKKRSGNGKAFAKRVRAVISKTVPHGIYRKINFGELDLADISSTSEYGIKYVFGTKKKNAFDATFSETNGKMVFFNWLKLMDAASVCYNGKAADVNWEQVNFNFPENLETRFQYASASLEFKNMTVEPFDVIIHECTAKRGTNSTPVTAFKEVANDTDGSTPTITTQNGGNDLKLEMGVKFPSDYKPGDWAIKSKKYTQVMPGQVITWSMIKKDFNVDFIKMIDPASGILMYSKGAVQVLLEIIPRTASFSKSSATTGLAVSAGGLRHQTIDVCWAVTQKEFYKLDQPGVTEDSKEGNKVYIFTDTSLNGLAVDRKYMLDINNSNTNSVANPVV